jgi:hypothetical protein
MPQDERRRVRLPPSRIPWQVGIAALFVLTPIFVVLLDVAKRFPLETLTAVAILAFAAVCIVLYVGELVVIGWIMDAAVFLTTPRTRQKPVPIQCEQIGEILVVKLGDTIATFEQCQSVQKQLIRLIGEHHCDFILDFSSVKNISSGFRGVIVRLTRAVRAEARRLGRQYCPLAVPGGELFRVFADRHSAVKEMARHDGHGWVVLCSVPVGIRAVSEAM